MKIKITSPIKEKGYQAGEVYDVPTKEAELYIKQQKAIAIEEKVEKKKDVKHGDR